MKETLAFSAPHDDYQETVGAVIVTQPNMPRVDLYTLHKYLGGKTRSSGQEAVTLTHILSILCFVTSWMPSRFYYIELLLRHSMHRMQSYSHHNT